VNSPFGIALGHNGNLTNTAELSEELFREDLRQLNTNSDSEVLLNVFAHELRESVGASRLQLEPDDVFRAVGRVYERCHGAYAVVAMIVGYGLVAFRDANGIRPLVLGEKPDADYNSVLIASESVALDVLGYSNLGDVGAGEAVFVDLRGNIHRKICSERSSLSPCIFEYVYLARPDSIIDDVAVYKSRLRMGEKLGWRLLEMWPDHDIETVIPVPDTSRTCALQLANVIGVKYREGFIKNRYIARTFIMPEQAERRRSVKQKLNAIDLEFRGKNVLLVDDSIVRGTTSQQIIQMAREAGARSVYFASAAPPVKYPNVYGIDMPVVGELVANNRTTEEVCQHIGADWLMYQQLEDLVDAVRAGNPSIKSFDSSCFDGNYVTGDVTSDYLSELEKQRSGSKRSSRRNELDSIEPSVAH
jgi:amidophosphoribosyltransferase